MNSIKTKSTLLSLLVIALLQSCGVEETDWEFKPGENGKLVVESILTTERKIQQIRLSLSQDSLNAKPTTVSGAVVKVSNQENDFIFSESANQAGTYQISQPAAVAPNTVYTLTIDWNGETYTAENQLVAVGTIGELTFDRINNSDSMRLGNPPGVLALNNQAMYEFNIDWSEISGSDSSKAQQVFYSFNTLDVNGLFRPESAPVVFPEGSRVIVKKYGLNDGFAAYLRALVMEVEWQGGLFDEASASLPTNISNGGLGYFAVCRVRVDTVFAE
ncbi:MAG: DUF4249 family protein [Saprospiraceae bacterium]